MALFRIRLVTLGLIGVCLLLVVRLFFIQVVEGENYRERADRQYQRPLVNSPDRGSIYFQTKDGKLMSAATMQTGFILAINPRQLIKPEETYAKLATIVDLDRQVFLDKAAKITDPYEELANRLNEEQATQIKNFDLPGVVLLKTRWRSYPAATLAAQVIGFMGYEQKSQTQTGLFGLERQYNEILWRTENKSFVEFMAEALAEIKGTVFGQNSPLAADLVLTIEPVLQQTLESELTAVSETYAVDSAGALVMDPNTGEILALAAYPSFNPGERQDNIEVLANPLVQNVYEMGSIFKPLTLAAALDAGVIKPETTYEDRGSLTIDGRLIANYDGRARGTVSLQEVLNQSLNTGAVFAMQQLGKERFREYLFKYGFNEKTGIDLPNEASGLIKNLNSPRQVEYATASFGQGIAITPIAMARALAALGNGGQLVWPHVVKQFKRESETLTENVTPKISRSILKPETSQTISQMLTRVVDEALANGTVKLEHYAIAAKTGTAQMAKEGGGYYSDRFFHSFFGYLPASSPRFLIFLYLVYPKNVTYASETLTPPFMNLTKFLINYYQLPPDR